MKLTSLDAEELHLSMSMLQDLIVALEINGIPDSRSSEMKKLITNLDNSLADIYELISKPIEEN